MTMRAGQLWEGRNGQKRKILAFEMIECRQYVNWQPVGYVPVPSSRFRYMLVSSFRAWALKLVESPKFEMIS